MGGNSSSRSEERERGWWTCLGSVLLILSLVMAIAALWLPLVRHQHMDILLDLLKNKTSSLEELLQNYESDFTQLRTQVLHLELEKKEEEGKILKLITQAMHNKEIEDQAKRKEMSEEMERRLDYLREEWEAMAMSGETVNANALMPTIKKIAADYVRLDSEVIQLSRLHSETKNMLERQENILNSTRENVDEISSAGEILGKQINSTNHLSGRRLEDLEARMAEYSVDLATLTNDREAGLARLEVVETDLAWLNSSFGLMSKQVTVHINTLLQARDNSTITESQQEIVLSQLARRLESVEKDVPSRLERVEEALTGRLERVEKDMTGRLESVENALMARLEAVEVTEATTQEELQTQLKHISDKTRDLENKFVTSFNNNSLSLDQLTRGLRQLQESFATNQDMWQGELNQIETENKIGNLKMLEVASSVEGVRDTAQNLRQQLEAMRLAHQERLAEQARLADLEVRDRLEDNERISDHQRRLTSLTEKVNHFLASLMQLKLLPMQVKDLSTRLERIEMS